MSAEVLLRELNRQGVALTADGDRLCYKAPAGVLTEELRQAIVAHKHELIELVLSHTAHPNLPNLSTKMTLAEFARAKCIVRVRSRILGEDVWWVSDETFRQRVTDPKLAIYTAAELARLVEVSPQDLLNIHRIKKTFDGRIEN